MTENGRRLIRGLPFLSLQDASWAPDGDENTIEIINEYYILLQVRIIDCVSTCPIEAAAPLLTALFWCRL